MDMEKTEKEVKFSIGNPNKHKFVDSKRNMNWLHMRTKFTCAH